MVITHVAIAAYTAKSQHTHIATQGRPGLVFEPSCGILFAFMCI